jgi:hypothetical protein
MTSNNNTSSSSGGLGFTGALTILFIALKLCHVINWSWWWVLSPIWISFSILFAIVALILIVALIAKVFR